ncbi:MAG: T9SS type A sorting domain-containing protein [Candidatus Zixiibacteriota bacterium]|nr:MAG: T9SS type A sorting domain-containing protein [candidate division Zixibacteria bacterium]
MKALGAVAEIICVLSFSIAVPVYGQWSEPINVGPPINSATQERRPSLTPFSDMMVLRTGRGNSSGLFTSHFTNGQWSELQYVPSIGNPPSPIAPALSPDGNEIYFSCYCGGFGDYDIWKVVYDSVSGTWSDPINLGPNINDWGGQGAPFVSYDGQNLYFIEHSIRFDGLVVSHKVGNDWSYPEWTHFYFASAQNVSLTMDERTLYFGQAVPGEYWAVFVSHKDTNNNWTVPERFDEINNYGTPVYPRVNADGSRIYFSSENMGGMGGSDIWYVEMTTAIEQDLYIAETGFLSVYPNPSNSRFNFTVNNGGLNYELTIYDIAGRKVVMFQTDNTSVSWDCTDSGGASLGSGVYFARFNYESTSITKKLLYLK